MRINEFAKTSQKKPSQWKKSNLLYEALPIHANITSYPIFNLEEPDSKSFECHKELNTLAYRKMLNWD